MENSFWTLRRIIVSSIELISAVFGIFDFYYNFIKPLKIMNMTIPIGLIIIFIVLILWICFIIYWFLLRKINIIIEEAKEKNRFFSEAHIMMVQANSCIQISITNDICSKYSFAINPNNEYGKSLLAQNVILYKNALECYITAADDFSRINEYTNLISVLNSIYDCCIPNLSIHDINNVKVLTRDLNLEKLIGQLRIKKDQGCIVIIGKILNLIQEKRK